MVKKIRYQRCAVLNCGVLKKTGHTFHKFPKNPARALKWVKLCGNTDLIGRTLIELTSQHYVCTDHFKDKDKYKTNNGYRLMDDNTVPTLQLPEPIVVFGKKMNLRLPSEITLDYDIGPQISIVDKSSFPLQPKSSYSGLKSLLLPSKIAKACPRVDKSTLPHQPKSSYSGQASLMLPSKITNACPRTACPPGVALKDKHSDNECAIVFQVCDPPEATHVFSDDEDDLQSSINDLMIEYDRDELTEQNSEEEEDSTCRTCGQLNTDIVGIFSPEGVRLHIQYKINTNLPIKVGVDDLLPTLICHKCLERLEACHLIRESSKRTDIQLKAAMALRKPLLNYSPETETPTSEQVAYQKLNACTTNDISSGDFISPHDSPENNDIFVSEHNYTTTPESPFSEYTTETACDEMSDFEFQGKEMLYDCSEISRQIIPEVISSNPYTNTVCIDISDENNGLGEDLNSVDSNPQKINTIEDQIQSIQQELSKKRKSIEHKLQQRKKFMMIKSNDTSAMSCTELADFVDKLEKDIELSKERMLEEEQVFTCSECCSSFTEEYQYNVHVHHHSIEKTYKTHTCFMCKCRFWSKYLLAKHKKCAHYLPKTFTCEPCNKTFKRHDNYKAHNISKHAPHGTQLYTCQICSKRFANIYKYKHHLKLHDSFNCEKCRKKFRTDAELSLHQKAEDSCVDPQSIILTKGPVGCPECDALFTTLSSMKKHLVHKHKNSPYIGIYKLTIREKSFACEICDQKFTNKPYLMLHMNIHTMAELYKCYHCDKTSYHKHSLMGHMKTHKMKVDITSASFVTINLKTDMHSTRT